MTEPYYAPYATDVNDGSGDSMHPVPGVPGATARADYLSAYETLGYTAHLGEDGSFVYTPLIPARDPFVDFALFPRELFPLQKVTARYFSPDGDPLGGFLTFMPSSGFTVTVTDPDSGETWNTRVPRRLSGTETWPAMDTGVSPWAFSMEGSGRIYIWRGLMVAKLLPTENAGIRTDDGEPLTFHVTEHFVHGRQFDIKIPVPDQTADPYGDHAVDLYSLMVPGTNRPADFDPVNPIGSLIDTELCEPDPSTQFVRRQNVLSTEYDTVCLSDLPALQGVDLSTASAAQVAYLTAPPTSATTWYPGTLSGPPWQAQALVGPTGTVSGLTAGRYQRWVAITAGSQYIVARAGELVIY